jgi:hypothetical protein
MPSQFTQFAQADIDRALSEQPYSGPLTREIYPDAPEVQEVAVGASINVLRAAFDRGAYSPKELARLTSDDALRAALGDDTGDVNFNALLDLGVLVLERHGVIVIPAFQFDDHGRLLETARTVNRIMMVDDDPWGTASFWLMPHNRLDNQMPPVELLGVNDALLVQAAEAVGLDGGW